MRGATNERQRRSKGRLIQFPPRTKPRPRGAELRDPEALYSSRNSLSASDWQRIRRLAQTRPPHLIWPAEGEELQ